MQPPPREEGRIINTAVQQKILVEFWLVDAAVCGPYLGLYLYLSPLAMCTARTDKKHCISVRAVGTDSRYLGGSSEPLNDLAPLSNMRERETDRQRDWLADWVQSNNNNNMQLTVTRHRPTGEKRPTVPTVRHYTTDRQAGTGQQSHTHIHQSTPVYSSHSHTRLTAINSSF